MGSIETDVTAGVGHIVLDRPEALNALNGEMIHEITDALERWRDDDAVEIVLVTSNVTQAFCVGGDIEAVRDAVLRGDSEFGHTFFAEEYRLNAAIADYPKPYVSVIDAAAFGGGLGITVHGSVRVVTENARLAMPETAIGFVPDVGSSSFLSRLPSSIGKYLALTGARIDGNDAVALGLATHLVFSETVPIFVADLLSGTPLADALARHSVQASPLSLCVEGISAVFGAESVLEMVDRLTCDSPWSRTAKSKLLTLSPTSLIGADALIELGSDCSLTECLDRELRFASWMIEQPDFAEGVRAMLVDKDRTPKWNPLVLELVQPEAFQHLL